MKKILCGWLACLCLPVLAGPASPESIERLLTVTRSEAMLDTMYAQVEQSIRQGMTMAAQGRQLSPEQQKVFDLAPARLAQVLRQELSWSQLKPMFVEIYRDTLEQAEVDGMLAFYDSPAGQAMIAKMPQIVQKSMAVTQSRMQAVLPRIEAAMRDVMAEAGIR